MLSWAIKAENLHSLERAECMMVRWMCGVSLKDRKRSVQSFGCSVFTVQSMAEVVRHGRLKWFELVECENRMVGCRSVEM